MFWRVSYDAVNLGVCVGNGMANRHFAKVADVWKHLPLVEILSIEQPTTYWESHAGSATYEMVDDPERRYGAMGFLQAAAQFSTLAQSRYVEHLRTTGQSGHLRDYPGSPMLAMLELGADCSYLFCDLDPDSVASLTATARRLQLSSHVRVVESDGMAVLHQALLTAGANNAILAHIDPYDPRAVGPAGLSALDLAREVIEHGIGLMYWYGYDRAERRAWAFDELSPASLDRAVWCGDVMVTSSDVDAMNGDLGVATTPGTGFGIVCANLSTASMRTCQQLGEGLAAAYDGTPLPDGSPGRLEFTSRTKPGAA